MDVQIWGCFSNYPSLIKFVITYQVTVHIREVKTIYCLVLKRVIIIKALYEESGPETIRKCRWKKVWKKYTTVKLLNKFKEIDTVQDPRQRVY